MPSHRRTRQRFLSGFSLIELLVVIAIISLLMAIVMPALSRARALSRLTVCLSNLREVGLVIHAYAITNDGKVPRGPSDPLPYMPQQRWNQWATNQLAIQGMPQKTGLGPLLDAELKQPKVLYCPADDTNDPAEELEKLERGADENVFSSYLYRQLDQTTRDRYDDLGHNATGTKSRALALDVNSLAPGDLGRTNHLAKKVNIVFLDGHAISKDNVDDVFSLRGEDYAGFPDTVERRLNEIVIAADYAENGDPRSAPAIP
ncbi:MAG: prepilin-type N-terminal cleavage/methylation domain-containing protein [Phycisphaerae bacterium]